MGRLSSLALLFIAGVLSSTAQKSGGSAVEVEVAEGAALSVECALRPDQRVQWRHDGQELPPDMRVEPERAQAGRLLARARAAAARPHHAGLYTCAAGQPPEHAVRVLVRPLHSATTEGGLPAAPAPAAPAAAAPVAAAPAAAPAAPAADASPADIVVYYNVTRNLTLTCDLPRASDEKYVWSKNGTELSAVPELKGHYALSGEGDAKYAVTGRAREDDHGRYECAAGGRVRTFDVRGQLHLKLPADTNVVEGQKLKLTCKLIGKPYPPRVAWGYTDSDDDNATFGPLGEHVRLAPGEQGVADAELVIEAAERAHAGRYECRATAPGQAAPTAPARTTLRVKDKYAALWPFIGICAEVFVLCAIILVYEKRRTKPEQEDSDTDNHDTKKS